MDGDRGGLGVRLGPTLPVSGAAPAGFKSYRFGFRPNLDEAAGRVPASTEVGTRSVAMAS